MISSDDICEWVRKHTQKLDPISVSGFENIPRSWTLGDSNPGPIGYEPTALTN